MLILTWPADGSSQSDVLALLMLLPVRTGFDKIGMSTRKEVINRWVDKGLWNISSCIAFLLAFQIAHIVTTNVVNSFGVRVSGIMNNHSFATFQTTMFTIIPFARQNQPRSSHSICGPSLRASHGPCTVAWRNMCWSMIHRHESIDVAATSASSE